MKHKFQAAALESPYVETVVFVLHSCQFPKSEQQGTAGLLTFMNFVPVSPPILESRHNSR